MKYHVLPMENPRRFENMSMICNIAPIDEGEVVGSKPSMGAESGYKVNKILDAARTFNTEMNKAIRFQHKKNKQNCETLFYLFDDASMRELFSGLKKGDEIILHGEGEPFILGLEEPSPYDLHAYRLAELLNDYQLPDEEIGISLLSCNSGLTWEDPEKGVNCNFARDLSRALHIAFGYSHVTVTGYKGYIVVKDGGKFSVCGAEKRKPSSNAPHASLEDANIKYENGYIMSETPRKIGDLSNVAFSWASTYIADAHRGNMIVRRLEQEAIKGLNVENRASGSAVQSPSENVEVSEKLVQASKSPK